MKRESSNDAKNVTVRLPKDSYTKIRTVPRLGDCGYEAFRITRLDAYRLIMRGLNDKDSVECKKLMALLKPAVSDALVGSSGFLAFLKNRGLVGKNILPDIVEGEAAQDGLHTVWSGQLKYIKAYIQFAVLNKTGLNLPCAEQVNGDDAYAHMAVLQALAYMEKRPLYIWVQEENGTLIPYKNEHDKGKFAEYIPPNAILGSRRDLVFKNNNHFDEVIWTSEYKKQFDYGERMARSGEESVLELIQNRRERQSPEVKFIMKAQSHCQKAKDPLTKTFKYESIPGSKDAYKIIAKNENLGTVTLICSEVNSADDDSNRVATGQVSIVATYKPKAEGQNASPRDIKYFKLLTIAKALAVKVNVYKSKGESIAIKLSEVGSTWRAENGDIDREMLALAFKAAGFCKVSLEDSLNASDAAGFKSPIIYDRKNSQAEMKEKIVTDGKYTDNSPSKKHVFRKKNLQKTFRLQQMVRDVHSKKNDELENDANEEDTTRSVLVK